MVISFGNTTAEATLNFAALRAVESMAFSLGIDVGSTAIKITAIDANSHDILAINREEHGRISEMSIDPNFHEQDPVCILEAVDKCLQGISSSILSKVSMITIAGQMHGVVCWSNSRFKASLSDQGSRHTLKKRLEILEDTATDLITWQDGRCDAKFLRSLPKSSSPVATGFGCASLFWLQKHKAESLKNYDCAGSIMDLLVYLLCDLDAPVMSPQIAHSWGYFDIEKNQWECEVLDKGNFPVRLLPKVVNVGESVGALGLDWHGIAKGTKVNIPLGDFQCSMLASCKKDTKNAVLNLGTSAQLASVIPKDCDIAALQLKYAAVQVFPYFNNTKVAVAASLNGGNVIDTFVSMLSSWLQDLGVDVPNPEHFYKKFHEFCAEEMGDPQLRITPTLLGERHSPDQLASVIGINKDNLNLPNVVRQLYVGIIENIFKMMPQDCLKLLGVEKIIGTGSVIVNNECVAGMVEEAAKLPCVVERKADASYGAALANL